MSMTNGTCAILLGDDRALRCCLLRNTQRKHPCVLRVGMRYLEIRYHENRWNMNLVKTFRRTRCTKTYRWLLASGTWTDMNVELFRNPKQQEPGSIGPSASIWTESRNPRKEKEGKKQKETIKPGNKNWKKWRNKMNERNRKETLTIIFHQNFPVDPMNQPCKTCLF